MSNVIWALFTTLLVHPVHETIAEIEWNDETKRLEVALRLDAIDDQWIRMNKSRILSRQLEVSQTADKLSSLQPANKLPFKSNRFFRKNRPATKAAASDRMAVGAEDKNDDTELSSADSWRLQYVRSRLQIAENQRDQQNEADIIQQQSRDSVPNKGVSVSTFIDPNPAIYHWVGIEEDRGHVWWFFEIEPKSGERPKHLVNTLLFEKESNQINRVIILGESPAQSILHTFSSPSQPIFP